ncbi:diacylglycerol kinase [Kosmotoga arenicorallina S304]|uniref:Diacylglycerol kinase n=1 Tax=Kosmotoga arenicorallina S304 TaxID=1453497 RepID=A0A176K1Y5_9BACT|nr:diacylglycerol kinase family protein [Kosmotoga arenicorallina]OAA31030.1 diacylglycerol kinase [Kosmotoga arenicorallina S304]
MKVLVIINPMASNGKALKDYREKIRPLLKKELGNYDERFTKAPGDAIKMAQQATGYGKIISVGGDGTLNEVVNGIMLSGAGIPVGMIGVGTGNDFSKTFGIPNNYGAMVKKIAGDNVFLSDVLEVEYKDFEGKLQKRYAINVVGAGFDADVTVRMNNSKLKVRGKLTYLMSFLIEFIKTKTYSLKLNVDGKEKSINCFFVAFGNGKYFGGGMKACPSAIPDDGKIDVMGIERMSKLRLLYHFPKIYKGQHITVPTVFEIPAKHAEIYSADGRKVMFEIDGEIIGTIPLKIGVKPKALRVLV